jgi:hypothetical protein
MPKNKYNEEAAIILTLLFTRYTGDLYDIGGLSKLLKNRYQDSQQYYILKDYCGQLERMDIISVEEAKKLGEEDWKNKWKNILPQ